MIKPDFASERVELAHNERLKMRDHPLTVMDVGDTALPLPMGHSALKTAGPPDPTVGRWPGDPLAHGGVR